MMQAVAAWFVIVWLMAIGWQSNNVYRAWCKMREAQRRYRSIAGAKDT